jgi:hypothetical protein
VAWRGVAWRGVAWRGVAWRGVAWRGVAWRVMACHGVSWRVMAWRGVAWRGVACIIMVGLLWNTVIDNPTLSSQRTLTDSFSRTLIKRTLSRTRSLHRLSQRDSHNRPSHTLKLILTRTLSDSHVATSKSLRIKSPYLLSRTLTDSNNSLSHASLTDSLPQLLCQTVLHRSTSTHSLLSNTYTIIAHSLQHSCALSISNSLMDSQTHTHPLPNRV